MTTRCYAYTRVSTVKQGEKGVSLVEQRSAIERFAATHDIAIVEWFEERVTAAKSGRPLFAKMLTLLQKGDAQGVVIHKIDRSARNLRDWAELGELIDIGVRVHFVNESMDLFSRGGRLSADIQAVVAADYVRNLREETRKGIRGRLKQGILPFMAPLGYLNMGGGKAKEIDPDRAPLIRDAFELYAAGRYSIDTLAAELRRRGLTNLRGNSISRNSVAKILNNPFYTGLIRIRAWGESYEGKHVPLISISLFKQVQARLSGRVRTAKWLHDFTFRGLFRCSFCGRFLVGEQQKGHTYYRCHTRGCATKSIREETLEHQILSSIPQIVLTDHEKAHVLQVLANIEERAHSSSEHKSAELRVRLAAVKERLARLVDALVDGLLDKTLFEDRKRQLLEEQGLIEDSLRESEEKRDGPGATVRELLELISSAQQSYEIATPATRRELVIRLTSNRSVAGKEIAVEPYFPVWWLQQRRTVSSGGPHPTAVRTSVQDVWRMYRWAERWQKRQEQQKAA